MKLSGFSIIRWQSRMTPGNAFLSEATTSGPIVMFGTKCPSMTSTWSRVPPPSSAALASGASREKFADKIEGAISIAISGAALLTLPEERDYTRKFTGAYRKVKAGHLLACHHGIVQRF